jgi:Winged helix-turn-helix DNA-binding
MLLLDQMRKLEKQLVSRLKELEPLTREYEQLRRAAERLGIRYSPAESERAAGARPRSAQAGGGERAARATRTSRPTRPRASQRTRSTTGRRAPTSQPKARASRSRSAARGSRAAQRRATGARPGQRQQEVLRLVAERPGITVREIGEQLGVDSTGLYRVVNRLTDDGRLRKDGPRLHPIEPAGAPETAAPPVAPTASGPPAAGPSETVESPVAPEAEAPSATGAERPAQDK